MVKLEFPCGCQGQGYVSVPYPQTTDPMVAMMNMVLSQPQPPGRINTQHIMVTCQQMYLCLKHRKLAADELMKQFQAGAAQYERQIQIVNDWVKADNLSS